jgi:hypothetical protein
MKQHETVILEMKQMAAMQHLVSCIRRRLNFLEVSGEQRIGKIKSPRKALR